MKKKLSKTEHKKAVKALNSIRKELEELIGGDESSKSVGRGMSRKTNFCPVIERTQVQLISNRLIGRTLEWNELTKVIARAYKKDWNNTLVSCLESSILETVEYENKTPN